MLTQQNVLGLVFFEIVDGNHRLVHIDSVLLWSRLSLSAAVDCRWKCKVIQKSRLEAEWIVQEGEENLDHDTHEQELVWVSYPVRFWAHMGSENQSQEEEKGIRVGTWRNVSKKNASFQNSLRISVCMSKDYNFFWDAYQRLVKGHYHCSAHFL